MIQQRVAHTASRRCMAWLLVLAIGLSGLTITRLQVLGSLHSHAVYSQKIPSTLGETVSNLATNWTGRWQQQNTLGHGKLLLGIGSNEHIWLASVATNANTSRSHETHARNHDSLERHHHAVQDSSVIAVDGAAVSSAAADSSANSASILLSGVGAPSAGPVLPVMTAFNGPWPVGRLVAFASRSVPPLLRPPSL